MRQYELTFIVDPTLSGDEVKQTAQKYIDQVKEAGAEIVHINEMGIQQLAYEINRRASGAYYCVEFKSETGELIDPIELEMRRDDNILRFLTVKLDKFGVQYNVDKRAGRIGRKREEALEEVEETTPDE